MENKKRFSRKNKTKKRISRKNKNKKRISRKKTKKRISRKNKKRISRKNKTKKRISRKKKHKKAKMIEPPNDSQLFRYLSIHGNTTLYKPLYNYLKFIDKEYFINDLSKLSRFFIEYHNRGQLIIYINKHFKEQDNIQENLEDFLITLCTEKLKEYLDKDTSENPLIVFIYSEHGIYNPNSRENRVPEKSLILNLVNVGSTHERVLSTRRSINNYEKWKIEDISKLLYDSYSSTHDVSSPNFAVRVLEFNAPDIEGTTEETTRRAGGTTESEEEENKVFLTNDDGCLSPVGKIFKNNYVDYIRHHRNLEGELFDDSPKQQYFKLFLKERKTNQKYNDNLLKWPTSYLDDIYFCVNNGTDDDSFIFPTEYIRSDHTNPHIIGLKKRSYQYNVGLNTETILTVSFSEAINEIDKILRLLGINKTVVYTHKSCSILVNEADLNGTNESNMVVCEACFDLHELFANFEKNGSIEMFDEKTWCGYYDLNLEYHDELLLTFVQNNIELGKTIFVYLDFENYSLEADKNDNHSMSCHSTALVFLPNVFKLYGYPKGEQKVEYTMFYFNPHGRAIFNEYRYNYYISKKRSKPLVLDDPLDVYVLEKFVKL